MICYWLPAPEYFIFADGLPTLLYYSHIPAIFIALLLGFAVYVNGRKQLRNQLLFALLVCFSVLTFLNLVLWTSNNSDIVIFFWSFFGMLYAFISILSIYFIYVYLAKKDINLINKIIFFVLILPTILFGPTKKNLTGFNLDLCGSSGYENVIYLSYYTFLGILAMMWIFFLLVMYYKHATNDTKKQIILVGLGIEFFLFSFFTTSFLASYLNDLKIVSDYSLEFYGVFGMTVFMSFLTFLIVRYKAFNIKLLATQALVWALVILIGSQFLFIQSDVNKVLTAITLVISGWMGLIIIRSVKKEVAQREKIEQLAKNLEKSNSALEAANIKLQELDQLKSEFVSLATHQIRAPLSAIKGYLSEVFEGDFGPVTKEVEKPLRIVFQSTENLVHIVGDFLNISRIEQGKMKYELAPLNLKDVAQEIIKELKPNIDRAGIDLQFDAPTGHNYEVYADVGKIKQVVSNLVDNSLKYTPKGSIKISLTSNEETQKVLLAISDTGIGIDPAVMPKLFQKFTRAEGANEVNIIGTGLGLYVAKLMIEDQQGRIWAESAGKDKGSQFYVELPIAHIN